MAVSHAPTHHVVHRNGKDAHIYIAPSLVDKLNSTDENIRGKARSSVCISFRKVCEQKYISRH